MSIFKKKGGQISATSIPMTEAEAALAQSDFNIEKITEIQNKFTGGAVLLVPGRIFIREGLLWKVCRKGTKKRQFFLFNDILVYGSIVASRYSNQHSLALDKMSVSSECFYQPRVQSDFDADAESLDQQLDPSNAFQISHADKSFHVFASSTADKANWLANLTKHISRAAQSVADSPQQMVTRPVWVPDAVAKECMVCQTKFSTFVRKHHCRRCGRVVCSACSPHHVSLTAADSAPSGHAPSEHSKLERVCKECFKEMTAQHNRSNSQSRPLRDAKVLLGSTSNSAVGGLPAVGQTTITKSPDHDSTDTEDSDDSSDEKEKQSALEQSKAGSHLKSSLIERRESGSSLGARTEQGSSTEGEKEDLEMVASSVRQLSVGGDNEREREEAQPTPPPRKKKLEKLLRKQIEESQKLIKNVESSVSEREEQAVDTGEADDTTPPDTTPRKARRKNKHSKPLDGDPQEPTERETTTADDYRVDTEVTNDQALREVNPSGVEAKGDEGTILEEKEMVDGATAAGEEAPTIAAADEKPEGEVEQEHSPSASQKRGRGRRKKFKTAAASEKTDDTAAASTPS